jgi:hypothetical protein
VWKIAKRVSAVSPGFRNLQQLLLQHSQTKSIYFHSHWLSKRRAQKCELKIEKANLANSLDTPRAKSCYIILSLLILSTNNVTSVLNAKQQWIGSILHILRTQDHTRSYMYFVTMTLINLTTLEIDQSHLRAT